MNAEMTSRQRVIAALSHKEPDRVPFDLGGIGPTGVSIQAYRKLVDHLALGEEAEIEDLSFQRARLSETFLKTLRVDTRQLKTQSPASWRLNIQKEEGYFLYFDEWGVGRKMAEAGGEYYFIDRHPLANVETEDLARYPWPDPTDPKRLEGLEKAVSDLRKTAEPGLVFGGGFSQGLLQFAAQLEGTERFFTDLVLEPYRAEWILEKLLELRLAFYEGAAEKLKQAADVVCVSDDFGHQTSQWISLEMFRKQIKPRYVKLLSTLKKRIGKPILFHSCGAIYPFLPDMIDMGVDALNPIQLGASGMGDTLKLKKEFGDALTFWGGGIDVQQMLPYASPREIEDEVKRRVEELAPGGGFVFAATQAIQSDTPPENVMAMWKSLQRYGIYRP